MAVIKVQTTITGFLFSAQIWLNGNQISLSYDGNKTWQSTDTINDLGGIMDVVFHGRGIAGTEWVVNVDRLEPDKNLFKKPGTITQNGHSMFTDAVKIS